MFLSHNIFPLPLFIIINMKLLNKQTKKSNLGGIMHYKLCTKVASSSFYLVARSFIHLSKKKKKKKRGNLEEIEN